MAQSEYEYDQDYDQEYEYDSDSESEYDPKARGPIFRDGMWIHYHDVHRAETVNKFPPLVAWRAVLSEVSRIFAGLPIGDRIHVGEWEVPYLTAAADIEVWQEFLVQKDSEDEWSFHVSFRYDYQACPLPWIHSSVYKGITIQPMGPVAPPRGCMDYAWFYESPLSLHVYDPHSMFAMSYDGRWTSPRHIQIPDSEWWDRRLAVIQGMDRAFSQGDMILLSETTYTYQFAEDPYTVRLLMQLRAEGWVRLVTIQRKGREFVQYTDELYLE